GRAGCRKRRDAGRTTYTPRRREGIRRGLRVISPKSRRPGATGARTVASAGRRARVLAGGRLTPWKQPPRNSPLGREARLVVGHELEELHDLEDVLRLVADCVGVDPLDDR